MSHKCYGRDTRPSVSVMGWEGVTQLEGQDADSEGGLKDELDPKAGANEFDRRTGYLSRHHGSDEKGEMGGPGTAASVGATEGVAGLS